MERSIANPSFSIASNGIGRITFDDASRPVNVLDQSTMTGLVAALAEARESVAAGRLRVLVIESGKTDTFIAGADIDAIRAIEGPDDGEAKARSGQAIYLDVENFPAPTVAAIGGLCLGGGLELALACRFRVCSDHPKTRLGVPEVQLGVLPGWGGTTRLPRLVGLQAALDLMLTGTPVSSSKAMRIGLVSRVLPHAEFPERVDEFALETLALPRGASRPRKPWGRRLLEDTFPGRAAILSAARRTVITRTKGRYPAPLKIIDVLRHSLGKGVPEALALEARAFGELTATPTHANLLHLFGLREDARKTARAVPGGLPTPIERIGVVGAGVMGGGIAQLAAFREVEVRLKDIRDEAVVGGLRHARELFDTAVARRKVSRDEADRRMALIRGGLDWHGFQSAGLVVEAVVERLDVKRSVLSEVEAVTSADCILATNTSSLSVDAMAEGLARPERLCGLHFFNPVHKMPLVEVVRGAATDDDTLATVHAFAVALGKVPVICNDGPGFLVNRILGPYLNEAGHLLADGASIEAIDRVATDFGLPMGPLRLMDEVGLDIARHAGATLHAAFGDRMAPAGPLLALADTERLGRKNGLGFYRYAQGSEPQVDPGVLAEIWPSIQAGPVEGHDEGAIRERLILAMINEAARVLDDRIVARAADVDLGMIMGTGFPAFRGGLLRFADAHHPRKLVDMLEKLESELGHRFAPAPVLRELAQEDRGFYAAFGGPE
jgi:3-hydroxyacyl-CoA dehydrogenase/enoyl-CoA hydratase/3-hydroxybutyryl-CoA epimerase